MDDYGGFRKGVLRSERAEGSFSVEKHIKNRRNPCEALERGASPAAPGDRKQSFYRRPKGRNSWDWAKAAHEI